MIRVEITQGQEEKDEWLFFNFGFSIRIAYWEAEKNLLLDKWESELIQLWR